MIPLYAHILNLLWGCNSAAQFSYLLLHECFSESFQTSWTVKLQNINVFSSCSFTPQSLHYHQFLLLVFCCVLLFLPKFIPTICLALQYKSLLCSWFYLNALISSSFKLSHSGSFLSFSTYSHVFLTNQPLTTKNALYNLTSCSLKVQTQPYLFFYKF